MTSRLRDIPSDLWQMSSRLWEMPSDLREVSSEFDTQMPTLRQRPESVFCLRRGVYKEYAPLQTEEHTLGKDSLRTEFLAGGVLGKRTVGSADERRSIALTFQRFSTLTLQRCSLQRHNV